MNWRLPCGGVVLFFARERLERERGGGEESGERAAKSRIDSLE
jgi:hypothetical protein